MWTAFTNNLQRLPSFNDLFLAIIARHSNCPHWLLLCCAVSYLCHGQLHV